LPFGGRLGVSVCRLPRAPLGDRIPSPTDGTSVLLGTLAGLRG
jgi:hypothetical protein